MDDTKQDIVTVSQPEQKSIVIYYPLPIFHNQATATSFSCVSCHRIPNKCYSNEENAELLCPECAQKAIGNGIKCAISHTIQKMINNLTVHCMNNDEHILLQQSSEYNEEVEGDNVGIVVCSWHGKLKDWSLHSNSECILLGVECPFAKYGCITAMDFNGKKLTRDALQKHMKENETKHLLLQIKSEMHLLQKSVHQLKIENTEKDLRIKELEFLATKAQVEIKALSMRMMGVESGNSCPIIIDYRTMLLNITKLGYKADDDGICGLKQLFLKNKKSYSTALKSGNCVDILLDLQSEYTFTSFEAWSSNIGFTCSMIRAYVWVFKSGENKGNNNNMNGQRNISEIQEIARELYAKQKFVKLNGIEYKFNSVLIDTNISDRDRNEMIAVACIDGGEESTWKKKVKIAENVRGRYILFQLICSGHNDVDAQFVGLEGYKMAA